MSVFNWKAVPSQTIDAIRPSTMVRKPNLAPKRLHNLSSKQAEILRDRFGGAYSRATPKEINDVL